jgi:hypothetical protein
VRRYGLAGKLAELAAMVAVERDAGKVERVGFPFRQGLGGALWRTSKVLGGASLLLSLLPGTSRGTRAISGLLGSAGSLALRFAVFHAGKASARDPRATFQQQRAGHGAAETTRRPAVTGSGRRAP